MTTINDKINAVLKTAEVIKASKASFGEVANQLFEKQFENAERNSEGKKFTKLTDFVDNIVSQDDTGSIADKANNVFTKLGYKATDYKGRILASNPNSTFSKSFTESAVGCTVNSCIGAFIEPFECDNNIWNTLFTPKNVPYCLSTRLSIPFSGKVYETAPIVADGATPPNMTSVTNNGCVEVTVQRRAKADSILKSQLCDINQCFDIVAQKEKNMRNLQKNTNNDLAITFITTNGTSVNTSGTSSINDALNKLKYSIISNSVNDDNVVMVADKVLVMQLQDEVDANQRPINPNAIPCDNTCPVVCYRGKYIVGVNHPALKPVTVLGVTTALVIAGQKTSGMFVYSDDNVTSCEECNGQGRIKMFNEFISEPVIPTYLRNSYAFTTIIL